MKTLHEITPLEKESEEALFAAQQEKARMEEYYETLLSSENSEETEREVRSKLASLRRASAHLRRAYLQSVSTADELSGRWNDLRKSRKRKHIPAPPANGTIDMVERNANHFASGMNVYKILFICYLGSFFGVLVEMLWCLLTKGYIESRAGLVYGPFNLLYGLGAVALSVALYRFRNHRRWISFLGGMLVGSIVEYACSWAQEIFFGSRSWDYSEMAFNLNGRICLLYSLFWGVLGVLWLKNIYPRMAKWILKIPNSVGKIVTWVLLVFFIVNGAVSTVAIYRWSQRIAGEEAPNTFWEIVDERFPDTRMEKIYANMEF